MFKQGDRVEIKSNEVTRIMELAGRKGTVVEVNSNLVRVDVKRKGKYWFLFNELRKLEEADDQKRTKTKSSRVSI